MSYSDTNLKDVKSLPTDIKKWFALIKELDDKSVGKFVNSSLRLNPQNKEN